MKKALLRQAGTSSANRQPQQLGRIKSDVLQTLYVLELAVGFRVESLMATQEFLELFTRLRIKRGPAEHAEVNISRGVGREETTGRALASGEKRETKTGRPHARKGCSSGTIRCVKKSVARLFSLL